MKFPKVYLKGEKNKYNFSYSGLKTAVINFVKNNPTFEISKVIKGFQIAAIEILYEKSIELAKERNINSICIAGGVAANFYLRELFQSKKDEFQIYLPDINLCTDNGAIVAGYGYHKLKNGMVDDLDTDVFSKPKGGMISYLKN